MHPQQFAGGGIERHGGAAFAGGGVEHAVHEQGSGLEIEIGTRAEIIRLEPPRHLERLEVGAVDLIERRVAGGTEIAAPRAPFTVGSAVLRADYGRRGNNESSDGHPPKGGHYM